MAFLDKLGSLAKNLGDKTNEAIAMSKLNGKITSEKALAETELRKSVSIIMANFFPAAR